MKLLNRTSLFSLALLVLFSGCAGIYRSIGDKHYENLAYFKASTAYEKSVASKKDAVTLYRLADCYSKNNEYKKAADTYSKVFDSSTNLSKLSSSEQFLGRLSYAKALISCGQYDKADALLAAMNGTAGEGLSSADIDAPNIIRSAIKDRSKLMFDTLQWEVRKASIGQVTEFFNPVKYKDGYVFSAASEATKKEINPQTGKSFLDLYFIKRDKAGVWGAPTPLQGKIKGKYHDGMATFTPSQEEVYYTSSNTMGLKEEELIDKVVGLKIEHAKVVGGNWETADPFPFNSDVYNTGHPTLSKDGKTMYFASDKPGGQGGTDLYVTRWNGAAWSSPENLGSAINTSFNEVFPSVDSLGNLYFASFGHKGMGGLDLYVARNKGNGLSAPENLGYPLNTAGDDFGLLMNSDMQTGYFSSNREGSDKIYEFVKRVARVELTGVVIDKDDGKPVAGVKVSLQNKADNTIIELTTDENGKFKEMLAGNTDYTVSLSSDGYFNQTFDLTTKGQKESFSKDFTLQKMEVNKPIPLDPASDPNNQQARPVFFDFNKSNIREDAFEALDKLARLMNDNPKITIEIASHTDSRGSNRYNQSLSERRAKATRQYLIAKGIKGKRIKAKGYGETKPVNGCKDGVTCTDAEHQANRRSEFKVINVDK